MAAEGVEEDSVQIIDKKKSEETSWSVTNIRLVIDLYRDDPVLYDKKMLRLWKSSRNEESIFTYVGQI